MKTKAILFSFGWVVLGLLVSARPNLAETSRPAKVRFGAVHVYVDSRDEALAAYQCEITAKGAEVTIVGIEGNEKVAAFAEPPYYDPKALLEDRLIIAAFSTREDVPRGKTRVATIHVQIRGDAEPVYSAELQAAGKRDGGKIEATVSLIRGDEQ